MARQSTDYIKYTCPEVDRIASYYADEVQKLLIRMTDDFKNAGTIPMRDAFDLALSELQFEVEYLTQEKDKLSSRVYDLEYENERLKDQIAELRTELEAVYE